MEDTDRADGPVVVFGGRSEIGRELATRLAPGATVILAARRAGDLAGEVAAVRSAGAAAVYTVEFDADDLASHGPLVDALVADHGPIGTAVLAFGILGDQTRAESDADHAVAIVRTDCSASPTSVRPPEASCCTWRNWREISAAVAGNASSLSGSSSTRICRSTPPTRLTAPTPLTPSMAFETLLSTNHDSATSSILFEAMV